MCDHKLTMDPFLRIPSAKHAGRKQHPTTVRLIWVLTRCCNQLYHLSTGQYILSSCEVVVISIDWILTRLKFWHFQRIIQIHLRWMIVWLDVKQIFIYLSIGSIILLWFIVFNTSKCDQNESEFLERWTNQVKPCILSQQMDHYFVCIWSNTHKVVNCNWFFSLH